MKNTVVTFREAKKENRKQTMITAYDYSFAKLFDEVGVNSILVGDSVGMVALGYLYSFSNILVSLRNPQRFCMIIYHFYF